MNERKKRLDLLLLDIGLASTRTKAQYLISKGCVLVDGKAEHRVGAKVSSAADITLVETEYPYASRGGLKLKAALDHFGFTVAGDRVLDVGQSTGGFTDVLLEAGAEEVVGVDVGRDQLLPRLRNDPRVVALESTDIREVESHRLGAPFLKFVADLSFISARHYLPSLRSLLADRASGLLLVKPQFELGPEKVGKGGIVREIVLHEEAIEKVVETAFSLGFRKKGLFRCSVQGGDGNQEFFLYLYLPSITEGS